MHIQLGNFHPKSSQRNGQSSSRRGNQRRSRSRTKIPQWKHGFVGIGAAAVLASVVGCAPNTANHAASQTGNAQENVEQSTNSSNSASSARTSGVLNQKPQPMTLVRHGHDVAINMYAEETKENIAPGVEFPAWTFDGTVPGPVLYLQQGDHVSLTLHNIDPTMAHSIDLHAAQVDPAKAFTDIPPGQSKTLHFVASNPGVFMYHCETQPMALHIAQGMYGAVIVTPAGQKPPTYTIVQSEFYKPLDLNAVENGQPNYVLFNGKLNRYVNHPLVAKVNQPITVAFVNAGPNDFSAFHVVGTILQDVQATGNPNNNLYDVQTYTVAPGDGALIHLKFAAPGTYAFVSHSMKQFDKGAVGKFTVTN